MDSKKLLLHVCCGPCSIMPATRLCSAGFKVIAWFHNPNIQPLAEYLRRREAALECAARLDIEIIFDDEWDLAGWLQGQLPRAKSAERCHWCCETRLDAAWAKAQELGVGHFSTSLLYSIYQPHEVIAARGHKLSTTDVKFVYRDFREDWNEGIELSRKWGIYRQPYCGCVFSEAERYAKKLARVRGRA